MASTDKNIDKMRAWYAQAIKTSGHNAQVVAVDASEFFSLYTTVSETAKTRLNVKIRGVGNIRETGFEMLVNGGAFKINPPSTQKKGVAETSREAYHSLDVAASVELVAKAAIELAKNTSAFTDVELAKYMGMQPAIISARRNDIEKAGVVVIDKVPYRLQPMGRKKNPSGKTANAWRLVAEAKQATLFQD